MLRRKLSFLGGRRGERELPLQLRETYGKKNGAASQLVRPWRRLEDRRTRSATYSSGRVEAVPDNATEIEVLLVGS